MPTYVDGAVIYRKYSNGNVKIRLIRKDGSEATIYRYIAEGADAAPLDLGSPGLYFAEFTIDKGRTIMTGTRNPDGSFLPCPHTLVKNKFDYL